MITRTLDAAGAFTRRDTVRLVVASGMLIAALAALLSFDVFMPGLSLKVNDIASAAVRAPRTIEFQSDIETEQARQAARAAVPPQYDYTAERADAIARQQEAAFLRGMGVIDAAMSIQDTVTRLEALKRVSTALSLPSQETIVALTAERWGAVRDAGQEVLARVQRTQIRDSDLTDRRQELVREFDATLNAAERQLGAELVSDYLVPNSTYSDSLTAEARDRAAEAVPIVRYTIRQNEIVVEAGHQVTQLDIAKMENLGLTEQHPDLARALGWFLLAVLLVILLLSWVWRFRRELWHRNNALLLVGLVLIVATAGLKVTAGRSILPFFVPTAGAGVLLTVLIGAGPATVFMAAMAIIGGAVNGSSLEIAAYIFLGGLAGIVAIRRGDRIQVFVKSGIAVLVVEAAVVTIFSLLGERDPVGIVQLLLAAAVAAGGSAIGAMGLYAVLGSLFGILTVFQLMELANPTQPVLRRLLVETPGTYHHSLMVGNLAERAAEAIGADPLLTRVAAYYHDIGKLANPLAFIENQAEMGNIHDQLDPEVSAQILKQHVPDGIDIAYKARLPKALIAFIPQHHGTAVMSYFYAAAQEQAAAPYGGPGTAAGAAAAAAVDQRKFRHAGPRPQSKEAALVMLADGVEASVRSLSSQDEVAIRAMVSRIIGERISDGQLDDCDLTLRDLERVREAFVSQLLGMYHRRIAYPQSKVVEIESRRGASGSA